MWAINNDEEHEEDDEDDDEVENVHPPHNFLPPAPSPHPFLGNPRGGPGFLNSVG